MPAEQIINCIYAKSKCTGGDIYCRNIVTTCKRPLCWYLAWKEMIFVNSFVIKGLRKILWGMWSFIYVPFQS